MGDWRLLRRSHLAVGTQQFSITNRKSEIANYWIQFPYTFSPQICSVVAAALVVNT
jgi:hypothetical protein